MRMLLLLLPLLAGLAPQRLAPMRSPPDAIRLVLAQSAAAWNRGDITGFMQSYWQSPQTEFVGSGGITRGWATVRDHYLHSYPNRAAMGRLTFSAIEVTALCDDAALATGHYHLQRALAGNSDGVFTLVFRRFPAGWRIISDHTTAVPAVHVVY